MPIKSFVIVTAFLSLFAFGCQGQTAVKKDTATSNQEQVAVQDTVAKKNILYVDVRTPQEYAEGSVNGAVNIPLDQVQSRIAEFQGKDEVVVFCRSGNRSSQAKAILEKNGIKNVTNGGTWQDVKSKLGQ